jgi:hypothetical protein
MKSTISYEKIILKDNHIIDGTIIPKGNIILVKKNNKENNK